MGPERRDSLNEEFQVLPLGGRVGLLPLGFTFQVFFFLKLRNSMICCKDRLQV